LTALISTLSTAKYYFELCITFLHCSKENYILRMCD